MMEGNNMSCCGQKRQKWRASSQKTNAPLPIVLQNPTLLYHLGESSLVIKGGVTGNTYLFAGRGTSLNVDKRDVPTLIAMKRFATTPPKK
jgi:hypothetical protein